MVVVDKPVVLLLAVNGSRSRAPARRLHWREAPHSGRGPLGILRCWVRPTRPSRRSLALPFARERGPLRCPRPARVLARNALLGPRASRHFKVPGAPDAAVTIDLRLSGS